EVEVDLRAAVAGGHRVADVLGGDEGPAGVGGGDDEVGVAQRGGQGVEGGDLAADPLGEQHRLVVGPVGDQHAPGPVGDAAGAHPADLAGADDEDGGVGDGEGLPGGVEAEVDDRGGPLGEPGLGADAPADPDRLAEDAVQEGAGGALLGGGG